MTSQRPVRAASAAGARGRTHHTLAPEHLSEVTSAATLAVVVGGVALVITGIGIIALAITTGARYGGSPPPNVAALALPQALLGVVVLALGSVLAAGGVAVLGGVRRSRLVTGIASAVAAGLGAAGTVVAMTSMPPDTVIAIALTGATLVFGVAAILLLRRRR
jgi:hypothetical protein